MQPLLRLRFLALIALLGAVPVASALELGHLVSCATWAGALLPNPHQRLDPLTPAPGPAPAVVTPPASATASPTPVAAAVADDAAGAGSPPGATRTLDWRALLPGALQH